MARKLELKRIECMLIQVSNIARSLRFWRDGLGIPFKTTGYGDDSAEAQLGDARICLHPDFDPGSIEKGTRGAGITLHLWTDDAHAYYAELKERGVAVGKEPSDKPWGCEFSVTDPDGYELEILGPVAGKKKKNKPARPSKRRQSV